jgi:hypothetical protein
MKNANDFYENFDSWLFMTPEQKRTYNPFLEFMSDSIKSWPKVNKPEIQSLVDEKITQEIRNGEYENKN